MNIIEIISKKTLREDNVQMLLGTEIKLRRNALSKTLLDVSQDTCSVSYLSKVENSEIKPNPLFLADICKRVNLTNQNITSIKDSKEIFQRGISAIYQNDLHELEVLYELVFDLKNYRAKITKLMYMLATNNLRVSKRIISELEKIESSMPLNDLIILAYLEAWYNFKVYDLKESFTVLKVLLDYNCGFTYFDSLCLKLMVDTYYRINSPLFLENSYALRKKYLRHNSFEKVKELEKVQLTYMLYNGLLHSAKKRMSELIIVDETFKTLFAVFDGSDIDTNFSKYTYANVLYLYTRNRNEFKNVYENKMIDATEDELKLLGYLYDKEFSKDFYNKLSSVYLPYAYEVKNYYLIKEFTYALADLLKRQSRYKRCVEVYEKYYETLKECEYYC